jgi:uncharacterized membrane protein YbhN (UPF0104 family)
VGFRLVQIGQIIGFADGLRRGRLPEGEHGCARPRRSARVHLASALGSSAVAALLVFAFCRSTGIDFAEIKGILLRLNPAAVIEVATLMSFNAFLAGEKWRLVTSRLRDAPDGTMPRHVCFAVSAMGVCLGQLLPTQVSTALIRSLAARAYGQHAFRHGVGATLFEQLFDVFAAGLLGLASVMVIILGGNAVGWLLCWAGAILTGLVVCGMAGRMGPAISHRLSDRIPGERIRSLLKGLGESRLMTAKLIFSLYALSLLRLCVLGMVAVASGSAMSLGIPFWHLAAASPFWVLALVVSLTPAALGVSEWSFSAVVVALGTSLQAAGQYAIAIRILTTLSAGLMGLLGILILCVSRWCRRRARSF